MSLPRSIRIVAADGRPTQATRGRIAIDDLTVAFGNGASRRTAVDHVALDVAPGEFVCLLGPSGCGKSTVLNVIAEFITPQAGRVSIDDVAITQPGADRGVVFQQPTLFPWKTVLENIAYGPLVGGRGRAEAERIARHFMAMVGLTTFAGYYPQALSGGMQQRVAYRPCAGQFARRAADGRAVRLARRPDPHDDAGSPAGYMGRPSYDRAVRDA